MAAKRKQDDKHLKLLRELGAKPENKKCFDCEQRGPTYVNMTVGSFVCTRCSGILRGINPPHRVKSISMTCFTIQEIEFLEKHGNEYCRQTWLGLENSRSSSLETKDEQKVRDYMVQKYERKRWYIPPSQVKLNSSSSNSTPEAQPLKKLVANDSPKATPTSATAPTNKLSAKISLPMPGAVPGPALQATSKPAPAPSAAHAQPSLGETRQPSMDLLGDLGGDPFAAPQQQQQQQQQQATAATAAAPAASGGFANFGQAFSSQPATQGTQPATFDPFGASSSFPTSSNFNAFGQAGSATPASNAPGGAFPTATAGAAPQAPPPAAASAAGFNAFGTAPSQPAQPVATSGFAAFGAAAPPASASVTQATQSLLSLSLSTGSSTSSTGSQQASTGADKYAIFSTLSTDSGANSSSGGGGSTSINWSGGGGVATSSSGGAGGSAIDWSGAGKGGGSNVLSGGGIDWGPGSNTNIKQPTTSSGLGLMSGSMTSGPNPFSGQGSTATGMGQSSSQPVYTSSMGGFGAQPAPQASGFAVFPPAQAVPGGAGGMGVPVSVGGGGGGMMNGGYGSLQGQPNQGGFGGMAAGGQMGGGVNQSGGLGGGFGLQPQQQGFPTAAGQPSTAAAKAGFGASPAQGFGAGFGMAANFGAAQPQIGAAQPQMGMVGGAGFNFGAPGAVGHSQAAAGTMAFGAPQQQQQQAMPTAAGGWPQQQQSNPFMGQADGFGSQQQPPAQRSTNPFM